jgi:ketosteroid isomerase-like protein
MARHSNVFMAIESQIALGIGMTSPHDLAIRLRRGAFNRALADADLSAVASVLAPETVLVAGTDSALISGRKAQLAVWKREFASPERTIYIRTPASITASPVFPIAFEHGDWRGMPASGGPAIASGTYTAKWRRFDEDWFIEAELYLTLA